MLTLFNCFFGLMMLTSLETTDAHTTNPNAVLPALHHGLQCESQVLHSGTALPEVRVSSAIEGREGSAKELSVKDAELSTLRDEAMQQVSGKGFDLHVADPFCIRFNV